MRRATRLAVVLALLSATGCATLDSRESLARRGLYLETHPGLQGTVRAAIENGHLVGGMSREMVLASIGWPEVREMVATPAGRLERWIYGDGQSESVLTRLYFRGEVLVTIEQDVSSRSAVALARVGAGDVDGPHGGRENWRLGAK